MVVGLIGLIIYPLFSSNSGLSNEGFAFLTGTTLPRLGQVKVVGKTAGPDTLVSAVNYKLIRISSSYISDYMVRPPEKGN